MTAHQTVEINSIETVLRELVPVIEEVQGALQSSLDNDRAVADAGDCARRFAEIRGTLQMLDLVGPSTMTGEMQALADALAHERVDDVDAALEVLLKAVFKLPDYLDRIRAGHRDVPAVLLPFINELRGARGETALDERAVFYPRIEGGERTARGADSARLQATARRLRPGFQRALLGWYRGEDVERHLSHLGAVLQELAGVTGSPAAVRLWSICGALTQSLADQGLEADNDVRILMGRVERLLSRCARDGEAALASEIPVDLLRSLLYYVARSGSDSAAVRSVKQAYQLDELLPGTEARADFDGPNSELLGVVGDGIRDDLSRVKDAVELYVHSEERSGDALEGLPERLRQVADTFSMLGMQQAHDTLSAEADVLARVDEYEGGEAEQRLQELADVLLGVENELARVQSGRPAESERDPESLAIRSLPDSEYRPLLSGIVAASLDDLSRVREAIGTYCDDPESGREAVAEVPALLDEVRGALAILPLTSAYPLVDSFRNYVRDVFVGRGNAPDENTQLLLADVVAGLEYYLEAVDHDRVGMSHLLESAQRAMRALESGGEPETHIEDEQVVIEAPPEPATAAATPASPDTGAAPEAASDDAGRAIGGISAAGAEAQDGEPAEAAPADDTGEAAATGDGDAFAGEYTLDDLDLGDLDFGVGPEQPGGGAVDADDGPEAGPTADAGESPTGGVDQRGASVDLGEGDDSFDDLELGDIDLDERAERSGGAAPATGRGADAGLAPDAGATTAGAADAGSADAGERESALDARGIGDPGAAATDHEEAEAAAAAPADAGDAGTTDTSATGAGDGGGPAAADGGQRRIGEGDAAVTEAGSAERNGIDPAASGSSQLAILGDEADDEIVEVFVEEALGELDKINENLPRWQRDLSDEDAVIVVRRAFHTLKGGGRLIGAELIGEFSWAMENMLNRVIDHSIDPSQPVLDTLDESAAALPQLIEQLQGNRAPIEGIDSLIERAHALSRGEEGPPPGGGGGRAGPAGGGDAAGGGGSEGPAGEGPAGEGPGSHAHIAEGDPVSDAPDEIGARGVDDLPDERSDDAGGCEAAGGPGQQPAAAEGQEDASADSAPSASGAAEPGDGSTAGPPRAPAEASTGRMASDGAQAGETGPAAPDESRQGLSEAGEPAEGAGTDRPRTVEAHRSDDRLTDIFLREAAGHQAVLHRDLGGRDDGAEPLQATDDAVRALHTLVGSAQTVEASAIAELAGRMERILKDKREESYQLDAETVGLFREALGCIDDALEALTRGEALGVDDVVRRLDATLEASSQARARREESDSELLDIFIEEGDEILEECDRAVARWRENPDDEQVIPDLQRGLHTLKGGARMANFPPIADLTHEVESLIDAIAEGSCRLTEEVFDLLQEAVDALTVLLEQARNRNDVSRIDWLVEDLQTLREQGGGGTDRRSQSAAAAASAGASGQGGNAASDAAGGEAGDEQAGASPAEADAGTEPEASAPAGDTAGARGEDRGGRRPEPEKEPAATPGSSEQIRVQSDLLDSLVNFAGEVSIYHSRINEQLGQYRFNIKEFEQTVNRLREQLRDMENETESQIRYSHAVEREQEKADEDSDFDPLEFDRYTRLHELSRSLSESVGDLDQLKEILENVTRDAETLLLQQSRVSSELQDGLMQTRMVRFDGLRARLARVVRQTASTVGKKVQMEMTGGELEVDRSIQERVVAPLEHVLRNAVSHGIESPEKRRAAGKPEQGTLRLDLHRGGTDIVIDISDDGGGIDPQAVRRKGIEKGLIDEDDDRDDNEIIKLILETGFSTADQVTQISGRGVGMDVVDAEIRRLGGTLGIHTELGKGTRFTVRLPVTLAINQAVMVQAGDDTYAIPIASIEGVAQVTAGDLKAHYVDPSKPYQYAGNEYRVQHLGTLLGTSEPRLENEDVSYPVIMIRAGDDRIALHVDGLVGRREVVVKPLGAPLNTLPGISGATIMADGTVVLILDIGGLVRSENRFIATAPERGAIEAADEAAAAGSGEQGQARTLTVLVVDDSITIRKVTNRILERNGIEVATAKDGVDAVSWLGHSVPDLILLDIEMPRMDGYEVAGYVRSESRLRDVPIIMITSRTGDKHRQRAEDIGVDRYLGKPYQEAELMEEIRSVMNERTTATEPA